jgi:hypothetical protein
LHTCTSLCLHACTHDTHSLGFHTCTHEYMTGMNTRRAHTFFLFIHACMNTRRAHTFGLISSFHRCMHENTTRTLITFRSLVFMQTPLNSQHANTLRAHPVFHTCSHEYMMCTYTACRFLSFIHAHKACLHTRKRACLQHKLCFTRAWIVCDFHTCAREYSTRSFVDYIYT